MMDSSAIVNGIFDLLFAVIGQIAALVLAGSLCLSPMFIVQAIRRRS